MEKEREEGCKGKIEKWSVKTKSQLRLCQKPDIVEAFSNTTIYEGDLNGITK